MLVPVALTTNTNSSNYHSHEHNQIIFIFYLHQNNKKTKIQNPHSSTKHSRLIFHNSHTSNTRQQKQRGKEGRTLRQLASQQCSYKWQRCRGGSSGRGGLSGNARGWSSMVRDDGAPGSGLARTGEETRKICDSGGLALAGDTFGGDRWRRSVVAVQSELLWCAVTTKKGAAMEGNKPFRVSIFFKTNNKRFGLGWQTRLYSTHPVFNLCTTLFYFYAPHL